MDKSRNDADEKAVKDVMNVIKSMVNPFENNHEKLVHISSGAVCSPAIEEDMKKMLEKGEAASASFLETHVIGEEPNIYSTIKKTNLQTFSSLGKKVTNKGSKGQLVAMKNSRALFARMLLVAESRNLHLPDIFKYSLRPFPRSLATSEGELVKTSKSKLIHVIEEEAQTSSVSDLPHEDNACILDGMAVLQTLTSLPEKFGELAIQLLSKVTKIALRFNCKRVDFVCDRYPRQSIKNIERDRRAIDGVQIINIYSEHQKVPRQWKKFLSTGENKEQLMEFLFYAWKKADPIMLNGIEVFLAHQKVCYRFFPSNDALDCTEIDELCCDHEEADTRMLVHANHASQFYRNIIIKSPDTDVFAIALNVCSESSADMFFETGVGTTQRIISLSKIRDSLGYQWCRSLIGLHAFTGS